MQGAGQSGPCHRYLAIYLGFEEIEDNYYHFSIDEQLSQMLGSGDEIIFLRLGKYAPSSIHEGWNNSMTNNWDRIILHLL